MLHWYGDAKSLEKSRFLASFFLFKNGEFGYLLVTQILSTFFVPKYLWHEVFIFIEKSIDNYKHIIYNEDEKRTTDRRLALSKWVKEVTASFPGRRLLFCVYVCY